LAAVPDHRHSGRLHDVLELLARRRGALRAGDLVMAAIYILASVVLSIAGIFLGLTLTRYVL
jgi:hypothetical protein